MILEKKNFISIDLNDRFFDSLKKGYVEFSDWYNRKAAEGAWAYTSYDGADVTGFLYVKTEIGAASDVVPALPPKKRIKVGTFKIDARGTKMGERFVKKIFDHAIHENAEEIYVTIFPMHGALIDLLTRYGFELHGTKTTTNGVENVYVKDVSRVYPSDLVKSYPLIDNRSGRSHLIAIQPQWHTRLLPDSILRNEDGEDLIEDVSHTNSIHKVYLCAMDGVAGIRPGDRILIYRPGGGDHPWFTSVATSICVAEEYRNIRTFASEREFLNYCEPYSVFDAIELRRFWDTKRYPHIIRFMYNAALTRRLNMKSLVEDHGFPRNGYWGYRLLDNNQIENIASSGGVHESLIVN